MSEHREAGEDSRDRRPALTLLTPLGLFALAISIRALPHPSVFTPDRIVFFGMDAYYHMRRVLYALRRFPETLTFDPYINFPHGAKPIWPPFFDSAVALVVWPFYSAGGERGAEAAAVWVPPVLGAATVAALYFAARRFFGQATATLAGFVLCLLSAHFWYSQLGFVDHHAAVALVTTLLLAAAMSLLAVLSQPGNGSGPRTERPVTGPAVAVGAALASSLLLWPGSLLHVGLVEGALLVFLMSRGDHGDAVRCAATLALVHWIALAIVLPFGATATWPQWGNYSPTVLSRFQPWLFGALALHASACWLLWRRRPATGQATRIGLATGLGAALLVASALLLPGLLQGAADAWQWLAKDEAFQASVAESLPLFELNGAFSRRIAEGRLSYFIYLLPVAAGAMAMWARPRADRAAIWFFVAWTLGLLAVTLVQRRFFNSLSVALALTLAFSVCQIAQRASSLAASRWVAGSVFLGVTLGLCAILLAPVWDTYRLPLTNLALALRGQPTLPRRAGPDLHGLLVTAEWLRHNTPVTSGYFEARQSDGTATRPEYGILARSGSGHVLEYTARRPTLSDNFGDDIGRENFERVRRYFSSSEAESLKIADELGARYVVVDALDPATRSGSGAMARRLALLDGSGLARHRLVFEASTLGRGRSARAHKVFEIVPGARVVGRAPAGALISVRLDLRTNRKRKVVYRTASRANDQGWYELRLPYATSSARDLKSFAGDAPCCTLPGPAYRIELLRSGMEMHGSGADLKIDEAQVQAGDTVRGPDFGS